MARKEWQDRLRAALLPYYDRLPATPKAAARKLYAITKSPALSARSRWVRDEYTNFSSQERRSILMSIASFATINRPIEGYYFEFGCHSGNTMRMAYDCFSNLFDWHYVGFDSFEGLPEITEIDRQAIWQKGKLKTGETEFRQLCLRHGIPGNRLTTVKGFYDVSLNNDLKERLSAQKAAVIYIDCDLYASTVPVLRFARHFLQPGTVVVFDDWNCFCADPMRGERRAWAEFLYENPSLCFEPFVGTAMQMSFVFVGATSNSKSD